MNTGGAKTELIHLFLDRSDWVPAPRTVRFLGAGEYNENYRVDAQGGPVVFRINHGSQLELDNQIEYEFRVLQAVERSGVTPKPLEFSLEETEGLGDGVLLMEFLPGRPLEYQSGYLGAATVFAKVHSLPTSDALITQAEPMLDIAEESSRLLSRFDDHPLPAERKKLYTYRDHIVRLAETHRGFFADEGLSIVNTEVNSSNFLVHHGRTRLVDWEKAVLSSRYQDLGHFLVPTTTLWKGSYVFTAEEKARFLQEYRTLTNIDLTLEELIFGTTLLESTIILRGLSWCYMAYYEYTQTARTIQNGDTFRTIQRYLNNIDWFLEQGYQR